MERREFIKYISMAMGGLTLANCGSNIVQSTKNDDKIKIVLLGFDGANWETIDPLIEKGKLPYLKQLKESSAWADFKTFKPAKSNVIWTSIVTGKDMLKHGIMDFTYLKKNGIQVPYRKSQRKVPTIWQIMDLFEKKSVAINWWVSHPPDKINGIVVSDHFRKSLLKQPDKIDTFKSSVYPEPYFKKIIPFIDRNYNRVLKDTGLTDYQMLFKKNYPNGNINKIPLIKGYPTFAKQDALVEKVSKYIYDNNDIDMFATYFRLPDIVQHFVTQLMAPLFKKKLIADMKKGSVSEEIRMEATQVASDILEPVYQYMEKIIKSYMEAPKHKNTYFFVMSDHGFAFYPGGYNHYNLPEHYKAPSGMLMIKGPKTIKGKLRDASVLDITPTMLYLQDLPVGKDMDGKILKSAFRLKNKVRQQLYTLKKGGIEKDDDAYTKETMKELKTLGYIGN